MHRLQSFEASSRSVYSQISDPNVYAECYGPGTTPHLSTGVNGEVFPIPILPHTTPRYPELDDRDNFYYVST